MLKRTISLLALAALATPLSPAPAANACGPSTAFENDVVKIWFQGFKGHFQIDNKSNGLSYDIATDALVERSGESTVADMNLGHAFPKETDTCTVEEADGVVTVTFSVTADVKPGGGDDEPEQAGMGGNSLGEAKVTYVVHFDTADNGSKFDLFVEDWPWQSEDGLLAFDFDLTAGEGTIIEPAENGVGFRNADAEPIGSFSWDSEFTTRYEDDSEQTGTVDGTTTTDGSTADVSLAFTGVDTGYDELTYDPWMGVGPYLVIGPLLINDGPLIDLLNALP